jgi:hypothetical protein
VRIARRFNGLNRIFFRERGGPKGEDGRLGAILGDFKSLMRLWFNGWTIRRRFGFSKRGNPKPIQNGAVLVRGIIFFLKVEGGYFRNLITSTRRRLGGSIHFDGKT